jgi:hypothetical protein
MNCPLCQVEMYHPSIGTTMLKCDCLVPSLMYSMYGKKYYRYLRPDLAIEWSTNLDKLVIFVIESLSKVIRTEIAPLPFNIKLEQIERLLMLL